MCKTPKTIWYKEGDRPMQALTACGNCWQCRVQRVDDFVGRCLAEAAASDWFMCVSLTYRDCPEREADGAHLITYPPHSQKFIRAMRRRGLSIRYLAVGEYGGKKGRAHFHVLLFGQGKRPAWPAPDSEGRIWIKEWPHGHVWIDTDPAEKAIRYTVKYLFKAGPGQCWMMPSKQPPLGHALIMEKAAVDHALGVLPSDFSYAPPGGTAGRRYVMTGATRRNYLLERCRLMQSDPMPMGDRANEWVQKSLMKVDSFLAKQQALADASAGGLAEYRRETLRLLDKRLFPPVRVSWHETEKESDDG